jgi:hypothetical protein
MLNDEWWVVTWLCGLLVFGMFVAVAVAHLFRPTFDLSVLLINA